MPKVSESKLRYMYRYDAQNTTQIRLKLNNTTDADVIGKLKSVDNKQGYIKQLIRNDIQNSK